MGASHVEVCSVSFATAFGYFSLATQLLLFRKNHARLACSVVNALTTARCRYRLLRCPKTQRRAWVIPLSGEMSAKQTKWCPNSGEFAPADNKYQITVGTGLAPVRKNNMKAIFTDSRKGCPYGFHQIKMFAELSLPCVKGGAERM